MVDYYALISPTIEPMTEASPEERKVVYDRLVTMLDQQLRAADPPRTDKDILKERINLEAAIRRIERRILSAQKQKIDPNARLPSVAQSPFVVEEVAPPVGHTAPAPVVEPPVAEVPVLTETLPPAERIATEEPPPPAIVPPDISEPEGLVLPQEPQDLAIDGKDEPPPVEPETQAVFSPPYEEKIEANDGFNRIDEPAPPPEIETPRYEVQDRVVQERVVQEPAEPKPVPMDRGTDIRPGVPSGLAAHRRRLGLSSQAKGIWLRVGIVALVILALGAAIGGVAEYLNQRSSERLASRVQPQQTDTPTTEQKLTDRLPVAPDEPSKTQSSGTSQTASDTSNKQELLIQRAILLEEPPNGVGDPKRTMGKVSWKLETIRSALTTSSDIGARATIDLSEAGLTASVVFQRNRDQTSANTHIIEITTTPSADNPNGKVRDVSVPELRVDEKSRGTTLSGIAVPVSDNFFLIGLSGLPTDMLRNIDLLRSRNWFLIPMRFANGKRALLLFEKGKPGERVFEDAMQTWQ